MDYAKFKEAPLPIGTTHLRVNHAEINYPFGSTPIMTLSIERRTLLGDGNSFGEQLDSMTIPLEGKVAEFDLFDRSTGAQKKSTVSLTDFSDILFSAGRFVLSAREAAIDARKAAEEAKAAADKLQDDPLGYDR